MANPGAIINFSLEQDGQIYISPILVMQQPTVK
jgi:hypothetical protein